MSRKSNLDAVFATRPLSPTPVPLEAPNRQVAEGEKLEASNAPPSPLPGARIRSGAVAAMGAALEHLASRAEAAERIDEGSAVVEIDPDLLDGSFVADRVADATDSSLDGLVESFRQSGQQIPILVRRHPAEPSRYQIAYGHRRAQAARVLGWPVRAHVRVLTDAELVVAQGKENLDRRNLSYIERAFFALRLETLSFPRDVICAAMGVHKPDVSNYISVARTIPEDVVAAIGPAPKAGGPRWRILAERIRSSGAETIAKALGDTTFQAKPTDERFVTLLASLDPQPARKTTKVEIWIDEDGRKLARIERADQRFTLSFDEKAEPTFGEYLLSRLPEILAAFKAGKR